MIRFRTSGARGGLTLVELVVVLAIVAALTMIILPRLSGLQNQANHAVAANSVADTARYIQTYASMKNGQWFPDGWDSLTDGTTLWSVANPSTKTKGLHPTAFASGGKFTSAMLSEADINSLKAIGIGTLYHVTPGLASTKRPGDMFTTEKILDPTADADAVAVAIVNTGSSSGRNIIDRVYRANVRKGTTGQIYDASDNTLSDRKLVALGFGPLNRLIGTLTLECPVYANVDSSLVYNRNLALFEVGGSKAVFKGVVAADGDLQDDLTTYINRDVQ